MSKIGKFSVQKSKSRNKNSPKDFGELKKNTYGLEDGVVSGGEIVVGAVGKCPSNKTSRMVAMIPNFFPVQNPWKSSVSMDQTIAPPSPKSFRYWVLVATLCSSSYPNHLRLL